MERAPRARSYSGAVIRRVALTALALAFVLLAVAGGAVYWVLSGDAVRRALERSATAWLGEPVRIGSVSVALLPRVTLRLRDVRAGVPPRVTLGAVDVHAPVRPLLGRRIEDAELTVSDTRLAMPLPFALPSGAAATPAEGAAAVASAMTVVSVRWIVLRDVTLASLGREIRISADGSLSGTNLTITALTAEAGPTRIQASGRATLRPRVEVTLDARADALDVDDLLAIGSAFAGTGSSGEEPRQGMRILGTVSAPRARAAGVDLTRFDATVAAEGGDVTIDPLTFDIFGGRHNGWIDVQLEPMPLVRVGVSVTNIDAAQVAAFEGAPGAITGRLSGSGRFGARGREPSAVLASARGVGELVIRDGSLRGLDVIGTVVAFLEGKNPGARQAGGEAFHEIAATFALSDGAAHSEDLTLRAPDYDIFARGTLVLPTKALDGRADVVLSETVSAQSGRDVYRYARAGTRIVLPATIGGTLGGPRVQIDVAAAIRRGVRSEIERRLEGLLERATPR